MQFTDKVLAWYYKNKRDLPWRKTKDPYRIWLSEIILQQTRVEQGMPYYHRFIKQYSTVKKLAAAKEEQVLKLWQGLGYYSRARNLHHAAKEIVQSYKGKFPVQYSQVRALKGVGDYTAAAITSFAYNQPYAVVDGNVFRLLSRYFGIAVAINSGEGKRQFTSLANELIKEVQEYADYNQAVIEFGALQCKPLNPDCSSCPLRNSCLAFASNQVSILPVKDKKLKVKERYFYYLVVNENDKIHLKRRTDNDIWKNLYDFPLIESKKKLPLPQLKQECNKLFGNSEIITKSADYKHQLTHQKITAVFLKLSTKNTFSIKGTTSVPISKLHRYPVPRLIEKYLQKEKIV